MPRDSRRDAGATLEVSGAAGFLAAGLAVVAACGLAAGAAALGDDDVSDLDRAIGAVVGIATHARDLLHQGDAGLVALAEEVYPPFRLGYGTSVMKNWEPLVPGPALA